ncbi:T-cell surface glycoprotein CD5 [Sciurus carolinensis]|uniref:T-cell surface glycoprotein CD5 n=1 Tax=Sciurus carolinensis TaxID=30640 RepID=A0AA41SWB8_SCICA|nr:T-cell surface glycoprotein CD5 [Sciurus carolinensis]
MGSQQRLLAAACLLGVLGLQVRLAGSNSRCQGQLQVLSLAKDSWHAVCSESWAGALLHPAVSRQAARVCQKLQCGASLGLATYAHFNTPQDQILCQGPRGSFSNCSTIEPHKCLPLSLICLECLIAEPQRTTPKPTTPPTTLTPEPTAPPVLQLVAGPRGLRCAGLVEFYSGGLGGTISYENQDRIQGLGNLLCGALQCGSLKQQPEAKAVEPQEPGERWARRPLPIRWQIRNASCASLQECFRKTQPQEGGQALSLVCSDFQPKVQSRLVGGGSVCKGTVEVRQASPWAALCDGHVSRGPTRWEELCQEQKCSSLISYHTLDASETSSGFSCPQEKLSQCHELREKRASCKRVFVTCQDPNPAGLAAGTVVSIILALVLLTVLLVVCGPLVYKKLVKKFRQKKQRQWIGPTGMNQNRQGSTEKAVAAGVMDNLKLNSVSPTQPWSSASPSGHRQHCPNGTTEWEQDKLWAPAGKMRTADLTSRLCICSVSFHRNHTATVRSQVENPTASRVDNEYSQPPRNSHLSAYPALEGALNRSSAQPDNSSDSDYDLHVAQRL